MIGDIIISNGIEFEVVFDGRQELLAPRDTAPSIIWRPKREARKYTKTGKHSKLLKQLENGVDNDAKSEQPPGQMDLLFEGD